MLVRWLVIWLTNCWKAWYAINQSNLCSAHLTSMMFVKMHWYEYYKNIIVWTIMGATLSQYPTDSEQDYTDSCHMNRSYVDFEESSTRLFFKGSFVLFWFRAEENHCYEVYFRSSGLHKDTILCYCLIKDDKFKENNRFNGISNASLLYFASSCYC